MNEKESAHFARNDSEARGGGLESRRGHDVSCPYRGAGRDGEVARPTALALHGAKDVDSLPARV
jgi:hypothetical protein